MPHPKKEIERRKATGLAAIKAAVKAGNDNCDCCLFVTHHRKEVANAYWLELTGSENPELSQIVDILVFEGHWSETDDNGIDIFDFTLPDEKTDYVLSVLFNETGEVTSIAMES